MIEIKLVEFFKRYDLHDSVIEDIEYISREMKLVITIELCRWRQLFYKSDEPEMETGLIVFLGVTYFQVEPNPLLIDSNEILDASFAPSENIVKIVFTNSDDIGIIMVKANSVFLK